MFEAADDILAFAAFPAEHRRRIWSNNPPERLHRQIRRRTDVVGIFPGRPAVPRLVGAALAERHDERTVSRRYLALEGLAKAPGADRSDPAEAPPPLAAE